MASQTELFIVMVDFGKLGREATVDPNHTWGDALATVRAARDDGKTVAYVLHVHDGVSEDRSEEAFRAVMSELADDPYGITDNQFEWIGLHVSQQAANSFRRVAA